MSISFDTALGMRPHALTLRAERAKVLSSNLANVDTPNYKARDFDFHSALKARMAQADNPKVYTTHRGHMEIKDFSSDVEHLYRVPHQASIDGNSVEGHVEHAEFMKNSLEFQVAFQLLNSSFKGLRKAFRGE